MENQKLPEALKAQIIEARSDDYGTLDNLRLKIESGTTSAQIAGSTLQTCFNGILKRNGLLLDYIFSFENGERNYLGYTLTQEAPNYSDYGNGVRITSKPKRLAHWHGTLKDGRDEIAACIIKGLHCSRTQMSEAKAFEETLKQFVDLVDQHPSAPDVEPTLIKAPDLKEAQALCRQYINRGIKLGLACGNIFTLYQRDMREFVNKNRKIMDQYASIREQKAPTEIGVNQGSASSTHKPAKGDLHSEKPGNRLL